MRIQAPCHNSLGYPQVVSKGGGGGGGAKLRFTDIFSEKAVSCIFYSSPSRKSDNLNLALHVNDVEPVKLGH